MAKRLNYSNRVCAKVVRTALAALAAVFCLSQTISAQDVSTPFPWPEGKRAAVSLTFDDARASQVDVGVPLFERIGGKVTFYVNPGAVERRLDGWKKAVAGGHEIANHSLNHPCSGNFPFARQKALEEYTLEKMRHEIVEGARQIKQLLGVEPKNFAYPCGQTFVGRGRELKSYVPLVAELHQSGRLWLSEGPTDPAFADMAQLNGIETDGKEFDDLKSILENAKKTGKWVVFAGHEIGDKGRQTTRVATLEKLVPYALDPANGLWLAPVGDVASYVLEHR